MTTVQRPQSLDWTCTAEECMAVARDYMHKSANQAVHLLRKDKLVTAPSLRAAKIKRQGRGDNRRRHEADLLRSGGGVKICHSQ